MSQKQIRSQNYDCYCHNRGERFDPILSHSMPHSPLFLAAEKRHHFIAIILLIFFFPMGLPYMWLTKPFTPKTSQIITFWFLGTIVFGFITLILWTASPRYQG
ncbi:MAG: hypothetical protein WC088_06270 [Candidatus Izemoplasmatales bacterium]